VEISLDNTLPKTSYDVVLYNQSGFAVRTATTGGGTVQFDVSNLLNGYYYVNITDNSTSQIITQQSVMIQH